MAERKWTPAQEDSIVACGGSVLVSAAAGSGKTAVLVERVIRLITDPTNPVDVNKLLIVTFTRAAAAEMRQRLSAALARKMAEEPDNLLYARQQMLLPQAYISTVHGFCTRLLREFAGQTGLPLDFRVAEEGQTELLAAEALDTVLEQAYRRRDPAFMALAAQLCTGKNDEDLRGAIRSAYTFMQAQPFPERWLSRQVDAYTRVQPLEHSLWMVPIQQEVDFLLEQAQHYAIQACAVGATPGLEAYVDTLTLDCKSIEKLRESLPEMTYDQRLETVTGLKPGRLPAVRSKDALVDEAKEQIKALRKQMKDCLTKAAALFPGTEAQCREDLQAMAPLVEALASLVGEYTRCFTDLKRRQKWLDYNDLEHQALELLVDPATEKPTSMAAEMAGRFTQIMVDEYQDTNAAQDALFFALSREGNNLFMVGDVKQSIYGFRQAMPAIFTNRRDEYAPYQRKNPSYPATITLGNNFRSRRDVTETVNFLFGQLMSRRLGGVAYGPEEQLVFSARYSEEESPTEWLLLDKEQAEEAGFTDAQAEARVIAGRIADLMAKTTVTEGEEQRPLAYRDICILVRKRGEMGVFAKELTQLGIPTAADNGGGLLTTPEVSTAVALLRTIDNPLREVSLTAALMSPLYGFTPDDLAQLRLLAGRRATLITALEQMAADTEHPDLAVRCRAFLEDLRRFRRLAVSLPADRLLETVYTETGIEAVFSARSGGGQRVANLRQLDRLVRGYDPGEYRGLSAVVRYIDRLEEQGKDLPCGNTLQQDGVRIMTVHGSKGLEFPVVFLARLGGQSGNDDSRQKLLFHATTGIGMKLVDQEENEKYNPLPYEAVRAARRLDEAAEELRVWYVALTRAREKLVLVHTARDPKRLLEKLEMEMPQSRELLPGTLVRAHSPGEMLLAAALRHPGFGALRHLPETQALPADTTWLVTLNPTLDAQICPEQTEMPKADTVLFEELSRRRDYVYPYAPLLGVPAKLAASQLSHQKMSRDYVAASRPAFLQEEGMTAAQKGTATHTFMQFADYQQAYAGLEQEIQRMADLGFLTRQQAESLDIQRLSAFFQSPLYRRMTCAEQMWREFPFAVMVPAGSLTDLPPEMAGEEVLVQGIADCVFQEGDHLILVDYKTDRVDTPEELCDRYRQQMHFYQQALETILGLPVSQVLLYSFAMGKVVEMN